MRATAQMLALLGLSVVGLSLTGLTGILHATPAPEQAQREAGSRSIEVEPSTLTLQVGERARITAVVRDPAGEPIADAVVVYFSTAPAAVRVDATGAVQAFRAGEHTIVALHPAATEHAADTLRRDDPGIRVTVPVTVSPSPVATLGIDGLPARLYVGATVPVGVIGLDAGQVRRDVRAVLRTSDPEVASTVNFGPQFGGSRNAHPFYHRDRPDLYPGEATGLLTGVRAGTVTVIAEADGVVAEQEVTVEDNPTARLGLTAAQESARTGDVIRFTATARDAGGRTVADVPVRYALEAWPDPSRPETVGAGAPAQILADGRFVAEQAGLYTVLATSGNVLARRSVLITPRDVARPIELVGHARVADGMTSDLWVWEGVDGRDYAVLGTWNSDGKALFFDVTDPAAMEAIGEVQVDARTVNDVKVSEDGRIAVMTREGASNRRNGFVVLDVSDPRNVTVLSRFDDQMTGGVHNVFIADNHVYAINNGRRWDVINIEDPTKPARVARFEDRNPGRSVHDVWVRDGIAFQAGNSDGLILVDVGGGGRGGSPTRPLEMGRLPQLTGWNHAVWPFRSRSADTFYVVAGDEAHPVNPRVPGPIISWEERVPSRAMGWIHFVEFGDLEEPREVARYAVPEAGPHNLWIDWEQEIMYVAYFNGGLRVVDVSGELVGDLYRQGREIAKFYSDDTQGYVPNAPFVWGPQPHKGTIFFSDFNSGLWAVRLLPREEAGEPSR